MLGGWAPVPSCWNAFWTGVHMPQQQSGPLYIQPLTLVQLSHEALAETLHLAGALALGLEIRPTLRQVAGMGQREAPQPM